MPHGGRCRAVALVTILVGLSLQAAVLDAADFTTIDKDDCTVGGMTVTHRSLHYYQDKTYVSCLHGKASCYRTGHLHTEAVEIACPTEGLQAMLDAYKKTDTLVSRRRRLRLRQRHLSLAVKAKDRVWEGGVVCYNLNSSYPFNASERGLIGSAMQHYEMTTNVRFLPITKCRSDSQLANYCGGCANYLDYKRPETGRDCNSSIGVTNRGALVMNLAKRCFESDNLKADFGSAMHEIGHSLGLYHEHQHPKRTIAIFWDDLPQSLWGEMKMREDVIGGKYDLDSIMHYPAQNYGFCVPKYCTDTVTSDCVAPGTKFCHLNDDNANCVTPKKTMCDPDATSQVGQRKKLSDGDLAAINELYPTASWSATQSKIA